MTLKEYEYATPYVDKIYRIQRLKLDYDNTIDQSVADYTAKEQLTHIAASIIDIMDRVTAKQFIAFGMSKLEEIRENSIKEINSIDIRDSDLK